MSASIIARPECTERSARRPYAITRRLRTVVPCAVLLFAACTQQQVQAYPRPGGVEVLNPVLAERIAQIELKSPKFRAAWQMVQSSGVPIRIGTDADVRDQLPSWYRNNPDHWAGVTVARGGEGNLTGAVVALRVDQIQRFADEHAYAEGYLENELDRVLIHEIYGHLVPVVEARDMSKGCPDAPRPGEEKPCVAIREEEIAAELERYGNAIDVTVTSGARGSQPSRSQVLPPRKR